MRVVGVLLILYFPSVFNIGAQDNARTIEEFYATFYQEIAEKQIEGNLIEANALEKYLPHLEQQLEAAVHLTSKTPEYLIDESNFLIDAANYLNVRTFDGMEFFTYPALDYAIKIRENAVCYPIKCDPTEKWRRTDGRCNNLNNPRWGAANVAQNRLLPAEWEKGANLPFILYPGTVIDVTKNGVKVIGTDHVILQAQGNLPLILRFEGKVKLEITLQPLQASRIERNAAISTVKLEDEVVGEFKDTLFSPDRKSFLWVEWADIEEEFRIRIGRGSECDEENTVFELPCNRISFERLIIEASKQRVQGPIKQFIQTSFYITSTYEIETAEGSTISLQNVPWVYSAHKSVVFGIVPEEIGHFNLALIGSHSDSDKEVRADIEMGLEEGRLSSLKLCDGKCEEYYVKHENLFSKRLRVNYFWVSWMGRSINIGTGQIVGKNAIDIYAESGVRRVLNVGFAVNDILVSSKYPIHWIFDIEQINVPRKTSSSGAPLSSARDISLAVHCRLGATKWSKHLSLMTFQAGQHVDHDVIGTPVQTYNGHPITCVEDNEPLPPEEQSRFCFNIPVTDFKNANGDQGNHPHVTVKALNFVRSGVVIDCDDSLLQRDLRVRNPMNLLTSFVDAGNLYSNSDTELNELRAKVATDTTKHTSQYMLVDEENELPPTAEMGEAACNNDDPAELCRKSGDFRNNENSGLNSLHTLWAREHNRIAKELTTNQGFPSATASQREVIFQHTRRIVIAQMQEIVYSGYLKSFMDPDIGAKFGLGIDGSEKRCDYRPELDPTMLVCFGIAYRMGHTWITEILREDNNPVSGLSKIELLTNFFNPHPSYENNGTDSILKYLAGHACPDTDRTLERTVTEDLFRMGKVASDLAALNIQRGRDHGCANYCTFRKFYGLYVPRSWEDTVQKNLMTQDTVDSLKKVYDCVCDLDLFTAVISETALTDRPDVKSSSLIGELLNYIMSDMFGRLRCGDRFWYEFDAAGFTKKQKEELSKATLSRILCDNVPIIEKIQKDVFKLPNLKNDKGVNINPVLDCDKIPEVDLSLFKNKVSIQHADLESMLSLLRALDNEH